MDQYPFINKRRNVFFYLHPGTHLMGIAGPCQVFWEANALIPEIYQLYFISSESTILSAQGLALSNVLPYESVNPQVDDLIILPGVDLDAYLNNQLAINQDKWAKWIKRQDAKGTQFFSIGSGTLLLAETGILDGKECTTHWKCAEHLKTHYPKIKFVESKIFIKDQNIVTSAGMSSNIDSTLAIVEDDHGPVFTARLSLELLIFIRRLGNENQQSFYLDYKTHFNPLVHYTQNIISSNLKKNYTNSELAGLVNTSERNLTRIFKKTLGISITQFKNKLRIELAKHLVHNKSLTVSQIAAECGYASSRQLQRIWKKEIGGAIKI
ncbi:GlxA family transcriptional regulator [Flagellimonas sp. 2504JD4-2]